MSSKALPIAVQMYTLRHLQWPLAQLLEEIARIGYQGIETGSEHKASVEETNSLLNKHGLRIVASHVALQTLEADPQKVFDFNKSVGNTTIVIPWIGEDLRGKDAKGWMNLAAKFERLGERCAEAGMRLLYHNHDFEMAEIEGKTGIEWLLDSAAPETLGWEADLAWIQHGKQDIARLLRKYAGRIPRVHAKDLAPAGAGQDEGGFADVGYGTVDWSAVLPAIKAAGSEWCVIEHDLPREPLTTIRRSFEFLKDRLST
ncbi:MAG: sugar phosphate isomerase/epimerase [Caldilineaceae bacterium]